MLKKYGEFEFKYKGETFHGWPSLLNISKIGTPSEIVHCIKLLSNPECEYWVARKIVDCCLDKELPDFMEGNTISFMSAFLPVSDIRLSRYVDVNHVTFVCVMAKHCIAYGVNGMVDLDIQSEPSDEAIKEFDPYKYIESAVELLDMSVNEAKNLTLTQYMALISKKPWFKEMQKEDKKINGFTKDELKLWKEVTGQ